MRLYCGQLAGLNNSSKEERQDGSCRRDTYQAYHDTHFLCTRNKNLTIHMPQRDKKRMRRMESDGRPGGSAPAGSSMPAENPYVTK